jgi:hypothetical protein
VLLTCRQSRLEDAHEEAAHQESSVRSGQALTGSNNTQDEHVETQEDVRPHAWQAHDHIAWDLDQDKRTVEDPQRRVVAIGRHVQALLHALDPGIGDYQVLADAQPARAAHEAYY